MSKICNRNYSEGSMLAKEMVRGIAVCPTAYQECNVSLEEKVDLILDHLKLDVTTEPKKVVLVERADG